jgi:hypothetical protein
LGPHRPTPRRNHPASPRQRFRRSRICVILAA